MKITSCGIIKNENIPRVGIISLNSLNDFIYDEIYVNGINISYLEMRQDAQDNNLSDDEIDALCYCYESDNDVYLLGDWKLINGKYEIDQNGENGFSASICDNILSVEYSKFTKLCNHTSPCYLMKNGDGPCGDLDSDGNSVLSYTLPNDYFRNNEEI